MARVGRREAVSPNDAVWLQDSATNRMVIHGIYTTDHIDLDTARTVFQERVIDAEGGTRYPRFTRRIVRVRGRWYWEEDPHFDIARHIVPAPLTGRVTADDLQDYIASIAHEPLPDDRPPWRIEYIEEFEDGESAFMVRIHHSMADGIAFVPVIFSLMDELGPPPPTPAPAPRTLISRIGTVIAAPLAMPFVLLERALWRPDRHALHGPPVGGRKRVAWTHALPLEDVKRFKNQFGATVNDVLMALVSGAVSRHLEHAAGQTVPHIRVSMPVNMRAPGSPLKMENRFAAVPLTLPSGPRALPERVAAVKVTMDALKRGLDPLAIYGAVNLMLTALPQAASRKLIDFFANKCTSVVTNVPGPQVPLAMAGRRLRTLMFWVPQRADIGIGISILTFAGLVQVGVIADTRILEDPGVLVEAIEAEFEEMRETLNR
jgi:diacylglycerol O-acyltransferase